MDDVTPAALPDAPAAEAPAPAAAAPAKTKNPVTGLRTLVADFQKRMLDAQTREFTKIKKQLGRLIAVPVTVRISDGAFILESFEDPNIFFSLGQFIDEDMEKYTHVFGKSRSAEQLRECLDATFEAHSCMQAIGYFAANHVTEVRIS